MPAILIMERVKKSKIPPLLFVIPAKERVKKSGGSRYDGRNVEELTRKKTVEFD